MLTIGLSLCLGTAALAQDDIELARDVLSQRDYPWYDASTDGIRKVELPNRPEAKSRDRADVPIRVFEQKKRNAAGAQSKGLGLSLFAWVALAFLIAGLAGLLIWAFFRLESRSHQHGDNISPRSIAESIENLPFQVQEDSGDFRQLAESAYRQGDIRQAITYLFSHVLVSLDQKSLIRLRKGKTNRQYLNELRPYRPLAIFFQQVMVPFEAVFFGDHELSPEDFESCWQRLDLFQDGVNQAAPNRISQVAS